MLHVESIATGFPPIDGRVSPLSRGYACEALRSSENRVHVTIEVNCGQCLSEYVGVVLQRVNVLYVDESRFDELANFEEAPFDVPRTDARF